MTAPISPGYLLIICFSSKPSFLLNATIIWTQLDIGLGGVYMTPGRLLPRSEFTPVPSHDSIFVYMVLPQNVMPARVTPA